MRRLVREGADVNQCSSEGFYPLCVAAFWGYADVVKVLLGGGADVNVANRGTGWTAGHCAAFQGHGKVLLQLMRHTPDVTLTDSMGRSVRTHCRLQFNNPIAPYSTRMDPEITISLWDYAWRF